MSNSMFIVDAFTNKAFYGNQAAVCLLAAEKSATWMQNVASEMNLSETAFIHPLNEQNEFGLRWFTPTVEVVLCGHATLATAHILYTTQIVESSNTITFETLSGDLKASMGDDGQIRLDFPAIECYDYAAPIELLLALGVDARSIQRSKLDVLIQLDSEPDVAAVAPDFTALKEIQNIRGVIVTAQSDDPDGCGYDFVSRFFAPSCGIDEDPVTGSAHCALAPYWMKRLGKNPLVGYQASKRGGIVGVRCIGQRVELTGSCVTMVSGNFAIDDEHETSNSATS